MIDRELSGQKVREFCEGLWQRGDPWSIESSEYERARCARLIAMLEGRRYARALEIGCGAGYFTRLLAPLANQIVAFDISATAIARARALGDGLETVDFRVANIMDYEWRADGPWDLVVFNDTICYLGWLYTFFDVAWLAAELFAATRSGGRLLLANTMDEVCDKLLLPYITRTYRDLFRNVGYQLETEEIFRGTKHGVDFEILISLFTKGPE
jgi:SAM-dependent methyltransferase